MPRKSNIVLPVKAKKVRMRKTTQQALPAMEALSAFVLEGVMKTKIGTIPTGSRSAKSETNEVTKKARVVSMDPVPGPVWRVFFRTG
jgi:hypothetical protein